MIRSIRCAVVGHGMIGGTHAGILAALPEAELVAVVEPDLDRLRSVSDAGIPAFSSCTEMFDSVQVEAVWVCTPPEHHRDIVVDALQRGVHVYCEKPIAHSLEDAEAMQRAASESTADLVVGHTLRFHPDVQAMLHAISDERIGEVVQANARWATSDTEGRLLSGRVSVAQEMSIHHIDILQKAMGPIVEVTAAPSAVTPCGTGPDAVSVLARFACGAIATLDHNWVMPSASGIWSDQRLTLFGSRGTLYFDAHLPFTSSHSVEGSVVSHTAYRGFDARVPAGALANADRFFLASLREGIEWPVSLREAISALEVALAIDHSLKEARTVQIGGRGED